jgi:hypothetical protein
MDMRRCAQARIASADQLLERAQFNWQAAYRTFPCCRAGDDFEHSYWPRIEVIYDLFLRWPLLTTDVALAIYLGSQAVAESDKIAIQHRVLFGRVWAQLLRETRDKPLFPG